jgi:hypothetical protein
MVVQGKADLLQVIETFDSGGRLTNPLDGRNQQANENPD